jgi:Tol biopolymer transport system component
VPDTVDAHAQDCVLSRYRRRRSSAIRIQSTDLLNLRATGSAQFSPNDREITMEDTHVWLMEANRRNGHEIGKQLDARQAEPQFSTDGGWLYFTAQERGEVHLYRVPVTGGKPQVVVKGRGTETAFSTHIDHSIRWYHQHFPKAT